MDVTALKYIEMMATLKVHISRVQGRGGAPKRNKWANLSGHDGVGVILRLSASVCVGRSRSGCVPSYDGHSPFMVHAKVVRCERGLCAGNERTRKYGVVLMRTVTKHRLQRSGLIKRIRISLCSVCSWRLIDRNFDRERGLEMDASFGDPQLKV